MAFGLDLGNLLVHLRADDSQYNRILTSAEKRLATTAKKLNSIGRTMTMRVTAPILAMGAMATKAFASFDDAMTKSLAIMKDATPEMRQEMESLAIEISKKSVTSATELAKSYFYLASAGLSAEQSIAALATVEEFAVAGAFDMALATDLVTDAQSALGLTVKDSVKNMKNMGRVTDVLVAANTLANASTRQFSEALMRAGPAMKAYGIEVEEGVAVLAAYADQGKKGVEAGEMFGRMLRLMIKGFVDNKAAWDQYGISIVDANDKMRPLADVIRDLTSLLDGMGVTQKATTLDLLGFQARSQQTILPLLGLGDAIAYYHELLKEAAGITKEIAEKQLKSFASQLKIVWNNVKAVGIAIGRILSPYVLRLGEQVTKATEYWDNLNESAQRSVLVYGLVAAAIGPVLIVMSYALKTTAFMIAAVKGLIAAFAGLSLPVLAVVAAILLFILQIYVLRAVWKQNVEVIKYYLGVLGDQFKQVYEYIANSVIGKFLKWFAKEFTQFFKDARKAIVEFGKDIGGMWAGIEALVKGEDFWQAFVEGRKKAEQAFKDVKKSAVETLEIADIYLKTFGEATVKHLEDLMSVVKKQFGEDADAIINLIKNKMNEPQMTLVERLTSMAEKDLAEGMTVEQLREQERVVKNLSLEEQKKLEIMAKTNGTVQAMLDALHYEYEMLGKTSEERERAESLAKFQLALQEALGDEIERSVEEQTRYNELMGEYTGALDAIAKRWREINEERDKSLEGWAAVGDAMKVWADDAINWGKNLGEVLVNSFDRAADAFAGMLMKEETDWKAFGRMFVRELAAMIIKLQAAVALKAMLGWASSATSFMPGATSATFVRGAPTAQHGGTVLKTGLAVIHEGEEFTPAGKINGGGIDVRIYNESRERLDVSEVDSYMDSDQRIIDVSIRAAGGDGLYRRSHGQIRG